MLWEIFRYDVAMQLRRYRAPLYCLAMVAATVLIASTFIDDARRDGVFINSPVVVAVTILMVTMLGQLVTAAVAGDAATRDTQARMEALLYTTPLAKPSYFLGRFLSAFAVVAGLLLIVPLTLTAARFMPGMDAAWFGPFRASAYVYGYFTVAFPNAFITTALLFSLVILTRRAMSAYLGGAALFVNSLIQDEIVAGALGRWDLAKVLDPFGFIVSRTQWRSMTILQRNTSALELQGEMLTNRLVWVSVSLCVLASVYVRFRMEHHAPAGGWLRRRPTELPHTVSDRPRRSTLTRSRVRGKFGAATRYRQFLSIAGNSYRQMITSPAALLLPLIGFVLYKITPELMEVALGTPGRPATARLLAMYLRFDTLGVMVGALIAFFAGGLVWRERDARAHDVADVAPVPDALSLAGKFLALVLMLVTLQAVQMAAGLITQWEAGFTPYQPMLHVQALFGLKLIDLVLFAAVAMAVHVIVNQKYLATAVALLVWSFGEMANELGIEHKLLIFAADPGVRYSDMSGFGAHLTPWFWFKLYWIGWALLFALMARLFWVRGHEGAMRARLALAGRRFTLVPALLAVVAVGVVGGAGVYVLYNTHVLNQYVTRDGERKRSADYEKRYGRFASLPQPIVTATQLYVDLHPAEGRANIRGTYRLQNRSGRPIDTVHLVTHRTVPTTGVTFDREARPTVIDQTLGYRIYTLTQPLAPGDSLRMSFQLQFARRGFTNAGYSTAINVNGTLLEHRPDNNGRTWLPAVGYRHNVELDHPAIRKFEGLPPRPAMPPPHDVAARHDERGNEHIDLETIISTDLDQTAVAPGSLRRSWSERGRRYYQYVTDAPIRNGFPILSARYDVHRSQVNGIDVEVLHHPKHAWNADRFVRAARASLDYYSRQFGPYPHKQLRVAEFPITGGNRMTGHPGTVIWSEAFAYAQPENDRREIDFPYAVVAHEVAHQWWGNQVVPARVEGAPLLSESLAWYSAMKVVEESFGREHFDRTMSVMRQSYLVPHETPEVPLLRANDWLAVYRTGALAMNALREAIGTERVNSALRRLVTEYRAGRPPFPTSLDLYNHLRAVTPAETQPLLKDLFEEITFWDFRMKSAEATKLAGGAYRVAVNVEAYKVKVGAAGRETRVPMNDMVDVTLFAPAKEGEERGAVIYRQRHRIHSGLQTITVDVAREPESAGIDADYKLLDRERDDNVEKVGKRAS